MNQLTHQGTGAHTTFTSCLSPNHAAAKHILSPDVYGQHGLYEIKVHGYEPVPTLAWRAHEL